MDLSWIVIFAIIAIFLTIAFIIAHKQNKFKKEVLGKAINEAFPNCEYDPSGHIAKAEYDELGCMRRGTSYTGSDLLIGQTKEGIPFRFSEVNTYTQTNKTTITVFKGAIFSFKYPKKFSTKVYLCSKKGAGKSAFKSEFFKTHKLETESESFNQTFMLYAEDDVTAFYLLTPQVMEKFETLKQEHKSAIIVSFKDEWFNVMIPNMNLFKAPLIGFKNKNKVDKYMEKTRQDLDQILNFVEVFNLDSKAFQ